VMHSSNEPGDEAPISPPLVGVSTAETRQTKPRYSRIILAADDLPIAVLRDKGFAITVVVPARELVRCASGYISFLVGNSRNR
jgi:hypothetical protein